jgi:uncharacterized protein
MPYLIDGYNLAHAMSLMPASLGPHGLESARRNLLDFVARHGANETVTVVFDARTAPATGSGRQSHRGVIVLFARIADDLIEDMIDSEPDPRRLTVVSGDNRLRTAARRRGCGVLDCLDFIERFQHPPTRPHPQPVAVAEDKPMAPTEKEVEGWMKEFGDGPG